VVFKAPKLPAGEKHDDEHFGPTVVYRGLLEAELPLNQLPKGKYSLTVSYQGCADAGLCYPPQTRTLELTR
jgi:thiol:disulfide interchange protein DsbD